MQNIAEIVFLAHMGLCWQPFPSWERRSITTPVWWFNPVLIPLSRDAPVMYFGMTWVACTQNRSTREGRSCTRPAHLLLLSQRMPLVLVVRHRGAARSPSRGCHISKPKLGNQPFHSICYSLSPALKPPEGFPLLPTNNTVSDESRHLGRKEKGSLFHPGHQAASH